MTAPFVMPSQKPIRAGAVSCPKCRQTGIFVWPEKMHGVPVIMSGECGLCSGTGSCSQADSRTYIQRGRDARAALTAVAEQVAGVDNLPF